MTGANDFTNMMTTSLMANALGEKAQERSYAKGVEEALRSSIYALKMLLNRSNPELAAGLRASIQELEEHMRQAKTNKLVVPKAPRFSRDTQHIEFPEVDGVEYRVDGKAVSGRLHITATTDVDAVAQTGHMFLNTTAASWTYITSS